jgi:putative Holliday junction resolvase
VTRLLGLDLGERRIGVAIADDEASPARPLSTMNRAATIEGDAANLDRLIAVHGIDELVVGLPLEASGAEGPQSKLTRAWADAIADRVRARVTLRDERLTSHVAEGRLGPMKRGRSGGPPSRTQRDAYRARIDREAAAVILQDELDARTERRLTSGHGGPGAPGAPGVRTADGG